MLPQEIKGIVTAVKETLDKVTKELNNALKTAIEEVQKKINEVGKFAHKLKNLFTGFVKKISGDMSFSTEKSYSVGLMKGWRAKVYGRGTLEAQLLPKPYAQGKASIGIDYATTTPKRQGNIVDISQEPSVKLKETKDLNNKTQYSVEFDPPIKALVPMMRSSTWVVCVYPCMCEG